MFQRVSKRVAKFLIHPLPEISSTPPTEPTTDASTAPTAPTNAPTASERVTTITPTTEATTAATNESTTPTDAPTTPASATKAAAGKEQGRQTATGTEETQRTEAEYATPPSPSCRPSRRPFRVTSPTGLQNGREDDGV